MEGKRVVVKTEDIRQLITYLKINSVSNTDDNQSVAVFLKNWLSGFCGDVTLFGKVNPLVRGYIKGESEKTICIYGHYDVQSAVKNDGWNTDPYEPQIIGEKIVARGACDNKGQNFAFLTAIQNIIKQGKRPKLNVLILLEGEEEIGSPHLKEYLFQNKRGNKANYYILADGTAPQKEEPALYTGSLGVVFGEIEIDNGNGDLHSGIYGKEIIQPANVLTQIIQELYSNSPKIVDTNNIEQWSFSINYVSVGQDPTKSIIPGKVKAMISYRFSSGLDTNTLISNLNKYFKTKAKDLNIPVTFTPKVVCEATESEKNSLLYKTCKQSLKGIGLNHYSGRLQGSLPVASIINELYGIDPLIVSFGSKDNNTHGANEFMRIKNIENSIKFFETLLLSGF